MSKYKPTTITEVLRKAVRESGLSLYRISKDTGVVHASLLRFMSGERSLRLDIADQLLRYLGIAGLPTGTEAPTVDAPLKAYRFKQGIDITQIDLLPFMLRMMMSVDAMRSSLRWYGALQMTIDRPVIHTDRLMSIIAGAGWAGEAILRLLPEGRRKGWIRRDMLSDPRRQDFWNKCFREPRPRILQKLLDVRNHYFAHWVPEVARSLIRRISKKEADFSVIEWDQKTFISSRFTWAYAAISCDLFEPNGKKAGIRPGMLGEAVGLAALMMEEFIGRMCEEHKIEFEPMLNEQAKASERYVDE
jgi:transcriptional regulator with XRE-family HTH domain